MKTILTGLRICLEEFKINCFFNLFFFLNKATIRTNFICTQLHQQLNKLLTSNLCECEPEPPRWQHHVCKIVLISLFVFTAHPKWQLKEEMLSGSLVLCAASSGDLLCVYTHKFAASHHCWSGLLDSSHQLKLHVGKQQSENAVDKQHPVQSNSICDNKRMTRKLKRAYSG